MAMGGLGVFVLQLLADDPYGNVMEGVTSTEYVGKETLDGHDAHHLRFTQEQFDWEMWIRADGDPTLQQLSFDMSKGMSAMLGQGAQQPKMKVTMVKQYEDWKFDQPIAQDAFTFQPPADAKPTNNLMEALAGRGRKEAPKSPLIGQPAPPVELDLLDGGRLNLQDHADKDIVMLDFWATWCPPCRREMPVVVEVAQQYRDRGVVFYAVNLREDRATIQKYLDETKLEVTVALDTTGSVGDSYQARGIPTLVLIDKSGVIRAVHTGFAPTLRDELVQEIDDLLAAGNAEGKPEQ
jgi:thiol-disulfide isomerase/thioredoxin